ARRLSARPPLAVWSSPAPPCLEMARLLAQGVAAETAPPILVDADLAEIDYGAWTGLTRMEVAARWPEALAAWEREPASMSLPGGETVDAARQRGLAGLERIRHAHASGSIAIVAQSVMQRLLLAHFLDLPSAALWTLASPPAALSTVEDHSSPLILTINDGGHLKTVRSRLDVQIH
ncbi:MAG: histidine phosphatase family protein, partial [Chloroflexota bacterium]